MIRTSILAAGLLAHSGTPALAAPCRDTKGYFGKCSTIATRCKDAKGKIEKCDTPGAKAI